MRKMRGVGQISIYKDISRTLKNTVCSWPVCDCSLLFIGQFAFLHVMFLCLIFSPSASYYDRLDPQRVRRVLVVSHQISVWFEAGGTKLETQQVIMLPGAVNPIWSNHTHTVQMMSFDPLILTSLQLVSPWIFNVVLKYFIFGTTFSGALKCP